MAKRIELPIIIGGKKVYANNERETYLIQYENDIEVSIPKVNKEDLEKIKKSDKFILSKINLQEIISLFVKVGRFWRANYEKNPLYEEALTNLCYINGYDKKMAVRELNIIGSACAQLTGMFDLVELELGNRFYVDEWVPRGDALVHVQPLGNVLNVMVGNVPVSSVMSLLRTTLTKNQAIVKVSKRDPITLLYFAMSMIELNPNHPVTQSMNVVYWPGGSEEEEKFIDFVDGICVWGGEASVAGIRSKVKRNINILEFGPKISYALVGKESVQNEKVAIDLAHDISLYDQEACFSPQIAFVEGDCLKFCENLKMGLKLYSELFPKGDVPVDKLAHISRTKLEALYKNNKVISDDSGEWHIIIIKDMSQINEHPLSRVIFIIPVENINECLPYVNSRVQTIGISPWNRNVEIRDEATLKGASKITEIGLVEAMRNGSTHDNIYPMQQLVRWVCVERGCDYWGKYIEDGPLDTTKWIMMSKKQLENVDNYKRNEGGKNEGRD